MTANKFPVEIKGVREYGVTKWRDGFYWPVSDADFISICEKIEGLLKDLINGPDEYIGDLLTISSFLRTEYWHFLHAAKVTEEVRLSGKDILCSEDTLWYSDIIAGVDIRPKWTSRIGITEYSLKVKARIKAAKILRNAVYNIGLRKLNSGRRADVYKSFTSVVAARYIKGLDHKVRFTSEDDWMPKGGLREISADLTSKIEGVTIAIISGLKKIAGECGIGLTGDHIDYLMGLTGSMLTEAARIFDFAQRGAGGKRKTKLLVPGFGDFFSRALYITLRKRGCYTVSFAHGGIVGLYDTPALAFAEFALSDEFVTYAGGGNKLFEKIKENHTPLRGNKTYISSSESDVFLTRWRKNKKKAPPKRIKRVMLIGCPHNQWRQYHSAAGLSLMRLDLELRLIDLLKDAGYEVLYKPHPERFKEIEGVFDDKVRVLKGYFEGHLDAVDTYLFVSMKTTAFSIALCTNKPIIAFKMNQERFRPFSEAMELLRKRCSIIDADFDERNRIVFDKERLLEALSKKPEEPNNEYFEAFMMPYGRKGTVPSGRA